MAESRVNGTRIRRVGRRWLELEEVMRRNGVRFTAPQLTDSTADFIIRENLLPVIIRRARQRRGNLF